MQANLCPGYRVEYTIICFVFPFDQLFLYSRIPSVKIKVGMFALTDANNAEQDSFL